MARALRFEDYTIAWIAVLRIEAQAAVRVLDVLHEGQFPLSPNDDYIFIGGEINNHNVVIATFPKGQTNGTNSAAALAGHIKARFPNLWFSLLVGVAAGVPNLQASDPTQRRDIRLGDVLVCVPERNSTGVIQYDQGVYVSSDQGAGFVLKGRQAETIAVVRSAIGYISLTKRNPFKHGQPFATWLEEVQADHEDSLFDCPPQVEDVLYCTREEGAHASTRFPLDRKPRPPDHRTRVWYGKIGSGNGLIISARKRDMLRDEHDIIGLEMEAAGVMNVLQAGVIRGVCDYADGQKDKRWQPYAAAVAAVYAKGILSSI
ncbi:nucleoside phosphorylase domain-containing protein, partial [Elsinoe ampelina]